MRVAKLLRGVAISLVLAVLAKRAYAEQVDCDGVGERVRAAVEENVERVLVVVEDAIVANEICVCEIVQGAILGSEGATDSVRAIVFIAVTTAPGMAATIAECAIAAAPDRAEEIRLALEAALVGDYENSIHDTAGKAVVDTSSSKSVQIAPVQNVQVTSSRGVSGPPSRQFSFFPIATGGASRLVVIEGEEEEFTPEEKVITKRTTVIQEVTISSPCLTLKNGG